MCLNLRGLWVFYFLKLHISLEGFVVVVAFVPVT